MTAQRSRLDQIRTGQLYAVIAGLGVPPDRPESLVTSPQDRATQLEIACIDEELAKLGPGQPILFWLLTLWKSRLLSPPKESR